MYRLVRRGLVGVSNGKMIEIIGLFISLREVLNVGLRCWFEF